MQPGSLYADHFPTPFSHSLPHNLQKRSNGNLTFNLSSSQTPLQINPNRSITNFNQPVSQSDNSDYADKTEHPQQTRSKRETGSSADTTGSVQPGAKESLKANSGEVCLQTNVTQLDFKQSCKHPTDSEASLSALAKPKSTSKHRTTPMVGPIPSKPKNKHKTNTAQPIRHKPILADSLASPGSDQSWDPHIDAFEILRAKITGITHTMQEFHVHELLNNQHSIPTLAHLKSIDTTLSGPIDMSPRTSESTSTTTSTSTRSTSILSSNSSSSNSSTNSNSNHPNSPTVFSHRRTRSHGNLIDLRKPSDDCVWSDQTDKTLPTSLSNLFLTTNTLIHSRLDELHQTSIDDSYNNDCNPNSLAATWRSDFLQLMSNCIGQSERLESISTDLLGMEGKTRALVSLEQAIAAEFEQREKKYEERLRECELASEQQQMMIESLEDLVADLELKIENPHVPIVISESLDTRLLKHRRKRHSSNADTDLCRWGFRKKVVDILDIETKIDWVHKARWEVAMVLGGGVGTGHVIHTFEGRLHGIEMIIAGSGLTGQPEEGFVGYRSRQKQPELQRHHYMIHLLPRDRKSRFALLPKSQWVADKDADQCQFERISQDTIQPCSTKFSFFQRRHHCRRCGKVICQRHSSNSLPLFHTHTSRNTGKWSRVCDMCFQDLVIPKP